MKIIIRFIIPVILNVLKIKEPRIIYNKIYNNSDYYNLYYLVFYYFQIGPTIKLILKE